LTEEATLPFWISLGYVSWCNATPMAGLKNWKLLRELQLGAGRGKGGRI